MINQERFNNHYQQHPAAGSIAVLFDKDGRISEKFTHGSLSIEHPKKIDIHSIFGIASMTKSFVALAILQLAEKGCLDLHQPLSTYLNTGEWGKQTSLHHLLTHSAPFYPQHRLCLTDIAEAHHINLHEIDPVRDTHLSGLGRELILEQLNKQSIHLDQTIPKLSYFNDGYGLMAEIVRLYSHEKSFADYLDKHIFKPLKMHRTSLAFKFNDHNLTSLYTVKDNAFIEQTFYDRAFCLHGAGAVKSTVNDLINYICFFMNQTPQLLSKDYLHKMTSPQIILDEKCDYGYGLSISHQHSTPLIGHGGSLPGVSSQMLWSPKYGKGIVILCNTDNIPLEELAERMLLEHCGLDYTPRTCIHQAWNNDARKQFYGTYRNDEGSELIFQEKTVLLNQKELPYSELAKHEILLENGSRIAFISEPSGTIAKIGYRVLYRVGTISSQ